jgi:hypothetical protein
MEHINFWKCPHHKYYKKLNYITGLWEHHYLCYNSINPTGKCVLDDYDKPLKSCLMMNLERNEK